MYVLCPMIAVCEPVRNRRTENFMVLGVYHLARFWTDLDTLSQDHRLKSVIITGALITPIIFLIYGFRRNVIRCVVWVAKEQRSIRQRTRL